MTALHALPKEHDFLEFVQIVTSTSRFALASKNRHILELFFDGIENAGLSEEFQISPDTPRFLMLALAKLHIGALETRSPSQLIDSILSSLDQARALQPLIGATVWEHLVMARFAKNYFQKIGYENVANDIGRLEDQILEALSIDERVVAENLVEKRIPPLLESISRY